MSIMYSSERKELVRLEIFQQLYYIESKKVYAKIQSHFHVLLFG